MTASLPTTEAPARAAGTRPRPGVIADDLACALDPCRLSLRMGLSPDDWQTRFLRSRARQQILLCSRQSGKSTAASVRAIHRAVYHPGSPVLCLSPSQRQSGELFRKVRLGLRTLGPSAPRLVEESALALTLANDSRVLCLPGKEATVRGYSGVKLLLVDEASRVPDELYQAIRPMLAVSGGEIVLLSTPFGKRGFFWQEWENGGEDWHRVKITARDCPRIPKDWLEKERAQIGSFWFCQEYECEFLDSLTQVFSTDDVLAALDPDVLPLFPGGRL